MTEPTPVRVRMAGETFTGRLLSAPNAIGLVQISNAQEQRTVPARWCEPLTDAAKHLLASGDKFVGEARDITSVISENPNEVRHTLPMETMTLQHGTLLRDFLVTESHRLIMSGKQPSGWLAAARYAKAWVKEKRQRDKVSDAGITDAQAHDPVFLLREGYHLIRSLTSELYKATGRDVFGDILPEHRKVVCDAMTHYVDFYAEGKS